MTATLRVAFIGTVLAVCACSDEKPSGVNLACEPDEHSVNSGCVPNVFDQPNLPRDDSSRVEIAADGTFFVARSLFVVLKNPATPEADVRTLVQSQGGQVTGSIGFAGVYGTEFPDIEGEEELDAKAGALGADPRVDFVTRNDIFDHVPASDMRMATDLESVAPGQTYLPYFESNPVFTPMPIGAANLWAYTRIDVPGAWEAIYQANPKTTKVVIAILDGDVVQQPVFQLLPFAGAMDARIVGSYTDDTYTPYHGTAVAAVIGAPNDTVGMNGIISGLDCLHYDLSPQVIFGTWMDAPDLKGPAASLGASLMGMVFGVRSGARVVNMSFASRLGVTRATQLAKLYRRIYAAAPRVLFVAGAGNEGMDAGEFLPAAAAAPGADGVAPNLVSVAATDMSEARAVWPGIGSSNYAVTPGTVTLAAPGKNVLSTLPDGRMTLFNGTSSATPVVSGVAALLFAIRPDLTGAQARALLVETADSIADTGISGKRINAKRCVDRALAGAAEKGKGTCRAQGENACPIGKGCRWCVTRAQLEMTLPGPSMGGTFSATGYLDAEWISNTLLNDISFSVQEPGTQSRKAWASWDLRERSVTQNMTSRDAVHIASAGTELGSFGDGTIEQTNLSDNIISFSATSSDLAVQFSGQAVSGTILLSTSNAMVKVTFSGTYAMVGSDGLYHCP